MMWRVLGLGCTLNVFPLCVERGCRVTSAHHLAWLAPSSFCSMLSILCCHVNVHNLALFIIPAISVLFVQTGACTRELFEDDPTDPTTARYYATGVLSEQNDRMYVGNSLNQVQVIETESGAITTITLPNNAAPASAFGVVASGSVAWVSINDVIVFQTDRLFLPSSIGALYAMNIDACQSSVDVDRAMEMMEPMEFGAPLTAGDEHARTTGGLRVNMQRFVDKYGDATDKTSLKNIPCVQWMQNFTQPLYSPTRFLAPDGGALLDGIVLASETGVYENSNGVLHAFDAGTGAELWNLPATFTDPISGAQSSAGLRVVPAVDPAYGTTNPVGYIGYGPMLTGMCGPL